MLKISRLNLKERGLSLEHMFQPSTLKEFSLPPHMVLIIKITFKNTHLDILY